jgi:2'-5' RNA ligase
MGRRLPLHLSYKCALALLPPENIIAPIEAVRRVHDSHFERWPPHINLLYPFLSSASGQLARRNYATSEKYAPRKKYATPCLEQDVRARLEKAVKHIPPFQVLLSADPPGTFSHSQTSKTVWLGTTGRQVEELQAALQAEFLECNLDPRHFTPHLTVGQAKSELARRGLVNEIQTNVREHLTQAHQESFLALDWYVDRVFVIERKSYKGRFEIVGSVLLGEQIAT